MGKRIPVGNRVLEVVSASGHSDKITFSLPDGVASLIGRMIMENHLDEDDLVIEINKGNGIILKDDIKSLLFELNNDVLKRFNKEKYYPKNYQNMSKKEIDNYIIKNYSNKNNWNRDIIFDFFETSLYISKEDVDIANTVLGESVVNMLLVKFIDRRLHGHIC